MTLCLQSYFHVSIIVFPRIHNLISTYLQSYFHVFAIVYPGIYNRFSPQHSSRYAHSSRFIHDDVIKLKHFPCYRPFGNSLVTCGCPSQRPWNGALMFSLICAWTKDWVTIEGPVIWDGIWLTHSNHSNVVSMSDCLIRALQTHETVHNQTECLSSCRDANFAMLGGTEDCHNGNL